MFQFETVPLINLHARTTGMLSFIMFRANSEGCCKNGAVTLSLPPAGTPSVQQHFICSEKREWGVKWKVTEEEVTKFTPQSAFTRIHTTTKHRNKRGSPKCLFTKSQVPVLFFFFNNFNSVDFPLVKFLKDCSNSLLAPLKYVRKENKVTSLQTSGAYPEDFVSQCC